MSGARPVATVARIGAQLQSERRFQCTKLDVTTEALKVLIEP
jgi:hypothetical protein